VSKHSLVSKRAADVRRDQSKKLPFRWKCVYHICVVSGDTCSFNVFNRKLNLVSEVEAAFEKSTHGMNALVNAPAANTDVHHIRFLHGYPSNFCAASAIRVRWYEKIRSLVAYITS
jgi:hypothetical protein